MYQEIDGNYEQAKEYYDKSALEYPNAEIVADARLKSKSIQQLLALRANIETLVLFHHEPTHDDRTLHDKFQRACKYLELKRRDETCTVLMAYEGLQLAV